MRSAEASGAQGGRRDGEGGDAEHSKSTMDLSLRERQVGQETTTETEYENTDEQTEQTDDNRCSDLIETDNQQH